MCEASVKRQNGYTKGREVVLPKYNESGKNFVQFIWKRGEPFLGSGYRDTMRTNKERL